MNASQARVVVLGGGPGGYEAALVAAALGANVTLVDSDGVGGACVLTDCVPSKALVATSSYLARVSDAQDMGIRLAAPGGGSAAGLLAADMDRINARIREIAEAQSRDITDGLAQVGVRVVAGRGRLLDASTVRVGEQNLTADMILIATGATPRVMDTAIPDGERILTWQQVWSLTEVPERLVVVGSGVTGAELAQAYLGLGSDVVLVSSRDRVLPGEDQDAAEVVEVEFRSRGMDVMHRSRMSAVRREGDGVVVTLEDGREVSGSHALLAVGSVPRTQGIGLEETGVLTGPGGHIAVDRVSRTSVRGIYAAGDCTGVLPLASVAAMQGRIAVAHALGDAVVPLSIRGISATVFTDPEIATVGMSQAELPAGGDVRTVMMPLSTNPRAKMEPLGGGFVKLFARGASSTVVGGVVVAPRASELIFPIALAVRQRLTVDQVATTITVYPSLSGSLAEAARRLHSVDE